MLSCDDIGHRWLLGNNNCIGCGLSWDGVPTMTDRCPARCGMVYGEPMMTERHTQEHGYVDSRDENADDLAAIRGIIVAVLLSLFVWIPAGLYGLTRFVA